MKERIAALALAATLFGGIAHAIEGGSGAYLLGSRDTLAGIVPVTEPELSVYVNKLDIAHFFKGEVFGGTPGSC